MHGMNRITPNEILLTKIIATLGPTSDTVEKIKQLILEGVRGFRINFSHGKFEEYESLLQNIREAEELTGIPVAVIGDLSGPKIRVGKVSGQGVMLQQGMNIAFTKRTIETDPQAEEIIFSTTYPTFIDEVRPGQRVLLDDGNVALRSIETRGEGEQKMLVCKVINGGLITSKKGINLPETELSVAALTDWDLECVSFAVRHHFNYLALSFVRKSEDIRQLKKILARQGARPESLIEDRISRSDMSFLKGDFEGFIPIIAKIEKPQALDDLDNILLEADFVMIARGDLGVEMDLAEVAVHQKNIIARCREHGVPVIVATQMLQSMINSPVPTRAEVSDVANAIFDGTDAVMLSGETAVGQYPVETVRMMNRIARKTNNDLRKHHHEFASPLTYGDIQGRSAGIAYGAKMISRDSNARLIINWTELGGSALFLSQQRIPLPVIAFSHNMNTLRILALLYGIIPVKMNKPANKKEFMDYSVNLLQQDGYLEKGDTIVFVNRYPFNKIGLTNELTVQTL